MNKQERLSSVFERLRFDKILSTKKEFAEKIGVDKTNLSSAFNGVEKYLTENLFYKIEKVFPQFNIVWLLTGEGEMIKTQAHIPPIPDEHIATGKLIPFYDAEAAAGTEYEMNMEAITHPVGMIEIGSLLRDSESALRVYGNSMTPNYPAGCVVGLRRHTDSFIEPGGVYVIETRENRYIKRLYHNKDKTAFRCVSDNHMLHESGPLKGELCYPDFEIPYDEVVRLSRVTGVIKRNIL